MVFILMFGLLAAGCPKSKVPVRALARGAVSAHPFFRSAALAVDVLSTVSALSGGDRSGGTPGLYGGTNKKASCDKGQLVSFLKKNADKAREWAEVRGIKTKDIERYVKRLTPVLLRNDTLVKNFDYDPKKRKRTSFYALLEAGVAVMIDAYGVPVVQCRCGNPLQEYDKSRTEIDVEFEGKDNKSSKKWKGYDKKKALKVEKAETKLDVVLLGEQTEAGSGLERPVGTSGSQDETLDVDPAAEEPAEVPDVLGKPGGEAADALKEAGFQVETVVEAEGEIPDAEPGSVTAQDPQAGTIGIKGMQVTLRVAPGGDDTVGGASADCAEVGRDFTSYDRVGPGSSGDLVRAAQCLLIDAGHDPGPVDGDYGEATGNAVTALQSERGLETPGSVGPATWTVLLSAGDTPELRSGSEGEAVVRLQRALTAALGRTVTIDGQFGPETEEAVIAYQSDRGLAADGVVGPQTWSALQSGA
ncbi:DUF6777 domain-containing protein [Streptomyces sp. NPDC051940]|uniref:DUF6777 domain-containing protein n=1 Tax=Streptomyces sp. NPDC051940 TaxID=3155675 RepID=UPI00342F4172